MKVKDVMTAETVKYCSLETNLAQASKIMKEAAMVFYNNNNDI
jgi:hypothetical protein